MRNKLKVLRAEHSITQQELAERAEVSRQTINAIEKEKYHPSLELAFRLAKVLDAKLEDLFYEEEKPETEIVKVEEHMRCYR